MEPNNLNIHQRLANVQKVVSYIKKEKTMGDRAGKRYVSHDDVVAELHDPLVNNGVGFTIEIVSYTTERIKNSKGADETFTEIRGRCWFINIDNPEDKTFIDVAGQGFDSRDLACGKAISYIKKYALLTKLLLETGEADPEAERPENSTNKQQNKGKPPNPQTKPANPPSGEQKPALHEQLVLLAKGLFNRVNAALKAEGLQAYGNIDPLMEDIRRVLESKTPGVDQAKIDSASKNSDKLVASLVEINKSRKASA